MIKLSPKLFNKLSLIVLFIILIIGLGYYLTKPINATNWATVGNAVSITTGGYLDFSNYNSNVTVDWANGTFDGYAYSEDLGWINFGSVDNAEGPVTVNVSTGVVSDKALVLSTGAYLDFSNYNSNVVVNTSVGALSGYVWSEDIGWMNFGDSGVSIENFTNDNLEPVTNASSITMASSLVDGYSMTNSDWTNSTVPYFSWSAGADDENGSGLKGYCLYLGTNSEADPGNSVTSTGTAGILTNSPVSVENTDCLFIVSGTSLNLGAGSYLSSAFTNGDTYYLRIKAIDNVGNTYNTSVASFSFRYDNNRPTNVSYISCSSGSFSNVADMNFNWPVSGSAASNDADSLILGWQYQINSTAGTWLGTDTRLGINYIPNDQTSRSLTNDQDGLSIINGNNIVYFRSVDNAGNVSLDASIRTCNLQYGGEAPSFDNNVNITVTPSTTTINSFELSWPSATATDEQVIANYYYMINTQPPITLSTLQSNSSTYIDNSTNVSVNARALPNVNKGVNTVYVVAVDDAGNYSPSNSISGTFTLNSTDPDNVGNLVASDSSIKSQSQWNVTLTWTLPDYKGAGNLTYFVYRSSDGSNFTEVGSTSGLSYVDNTPSSSKFYYKVVTQDGADAVSSGTNVVFITPTGKWTSAPSLESGPMVSDITTKKATISWSTSRTSDSKVQFGIESDEYNDVEPSNSAQVTAHSIELTGLNPETTYYYRVRWTDEDGNSGLSEEKNFTTAPAPSINNVNAKSITLNSAIIEYTVKDTSKVKLYYGPTSNFGGIKEVSTSTVESTYTTQLDNLVDGTAYYFKLNRFDSENDEYDGDTYSFETLPRPKISNLVLETVANTAETTIRVSWSTNTEVSSIVSVYPEGNPNLVRDEVKVALEKGDRSMMVKGLLPQTKYLLQVKGRDKLGNEAISELQRFTTAIDTRPPQIINLKVIGGTIPPVGFAAGDVKAQLIITWDTDEPSTSQIEFGQGSNSSYSQKSQYDGNLATNHTVILSGLIPSQVYHLRAISIDAAGNTAYSVDTATIAPKATRSAFDLVIKNLSEAFSFVKSINIK